jgi:hypothetical protein
MDVPWWDGVDGKLVVDSHGQTKGLSRLHVIANISLERGVATDMLRDEHVVDINPSVMRRRIKADDSIPVAPSPGDENVALIPYPTDVVTDHGIKKEVVVARRYSDVERAREWRRPRLPDVGPVQSKPPDPVQIDEFPSF